MATARRRISFSEYDANHLYELALQHFCVLKKEGVCAVCFVLKKRIEKFIGEKEVGRIRQQIKRHGYCKQRQA
jgi:hypothetical protein